MHSYSSKPTFEKLDDIKNKKITIMGLGLNGGGEACVRFFLKHGAFVTVTDLKTETELKTTIDNLEKDSSIDKNCLKYVLGKHELCDFENADCVIKNPGVKFEGNKFLKVAKNIETDLSLFLHFSKSPIIAVTGSKGKSSTVSAIHYILQQGGFKSFLGGNITVSPLNFLDKTDENTPVVLELSSWQLSDLCGRKLLKPKIAVITLIVPDHQNWYHSMEKYVADKKLIYADQDKDCFTVCNADDAWGKVFAQETQAQVIWYGEGKNENLINALSVPGKHMKTNVTIAALVCKLFGMNEKLILKASKTFPGIEHRLEYFHSYKNKNCTFNFYNDSASTVPESTSAALDAFENDIFLVTGGTDKECDFSSLAKNIHKAKKIFLLAGTGTDKLITLLKERKVNYSKPYDNVQSLLTELKGTLIKEAQEKYADTNVTILFSPGATSFGMFKNEFDRGNIWKHLVKQMF